MKRTHTPTKQVAADLGMEPRTLLRHLRRDGVPLVRLSKRTLLIALPDLEEWLARKTGHGPSAVKGSPFVSDQRKAS